MIEKVLISGDLIEFLEKRNLDKQYKKAKEYLQILKIGDIFLTKYFEKNKLYARIIVYNFLFIRLWD